MPKILVVEDESRIIEAIEKTLSLASGFIVESVSDPGKALPRAIAQKPDLILLDIRLPGGDGRVLLKTLKENAATRSIPVIFLTGLSSEGDKVLGLNLGADDYLTKPFGAMELLARIQAVLRRYSSPAPGLAVVTVSGLRLDAQNHVATFKDRSLKLQPREFQILHLLASQPGRTLSRSYLIENSSSYGLPVATRSLDTHIKNLRRKLGAGGVLIETVPKVGYRFAPAAR